MTYYIELPTDSYEEAKKNFEWDIPTDYNIASDLIRKHPHDDIGLYQAFPNGYRKTYTFGELDTISNQFAHKLEQLDISRGDRVAVLGTQELLTILTHISCWKIGAISVPLSSMFGPKAIKYRLQESEAKAIITNEDGGNTVRNVCSDCPSLEHILELSSRHDKKRSLWKNLQDQPERYEITSIDPDTPAIIMFTSGSTGPPKGVVHTHSVWIGGSPSVWMFYEGQVQNNGVYWTPADWTWMGALGNVVFPAWHYGCPVVGYPIKKFKADKAYSILEEFSVTNAFIPPTALRMMSKISKPLEKYDLDLNIIASGGEPLTSEIVKWVETNLPEIIINEVYGQTEANVFISTCQRWFDTPTKSMGKPVPGHNVAIVDPETGDVLPPNESGIIAIKREDNPMVYEQYWNNLKDTQENTVNGWHLTGDIGKYDSDGYVYFQSRQDNLITTSGYRVGPTEIEEVILNHPAVEQVGVVGVSDQNRGEIIKAFIQHTEPNCGLEQFREEIRDLVRNELAAYVYPREIAFIGTLPRTNSGKIDRKKLIEIDDSDEIN